jgi:thiol-disulfide isomerase/thioredoxin
MVTSLIAQPLTAGWWRLSLLRNDSATIDFNAEIRYTAGKPTWFIRNASERIAVKDIQQKGDSLFVQMPLFESSFQLHIENKGLLRGTWTKGTSRQTQVMPVVMVYNKPARYPVSKKPAFNVSGRWAVTFVDENVPEPSVAEFKQTGRQLTGTFLTPTGDYRYLEGVVDGNMIHLSTFDGSHAYYFKARINSATSITDGLYYSGASFKESWTAVKNSKASIPDSIAAVSLRKGEERLHFRFPDLDSNLVSIDDPRFKNKVVIVQIMGSWCPNCMDETAFLSDYYNKNKGKGIEAVALAYEYSTDFRRSEKGLRKFQ